ncbi:MAG: hypothetical protein F2839_05715 [Actinobacteria bacterium]|uniref:Unannotated protein n=1 Tax=freshwater metagenome TaxID=449393 RepID=A0A6J5ZLE6_9ZZZZ|nr:hypothetical protein [Actinomycetota bacterium]
MIRLGSLAGYPFEGPRVLAGWTPPAVPAVYAIMCRNDAEGKPQEYSVIYVDHAQDLSQVGFPFRHPRSASWIARAGNKFNLQIAYFELHGGRESHREQMCHELLAIYEPSCNDEKFDKAWKAEWIGDYNTPVTDPLTTIRDPNASL